MRKQAMEAFLTGLGVHSRLPLWTFSYNRAGSAPFLNSMSAWQNQADINIVVRASQLHDYARAYPWARLHPVPDRLDCVGYSRQTALDLAHLEGQELVLLTDDDLTNTSFLFEGVIKSGSNAGQPCSSRSPKNHRLPGGELAEYILAGMSEVGQRVEAAHPRAVLGGALKQHGAWTPERHETMYRLNGGVTPKQLMVAAPGRMARAGVRLDVDEFGRHGDDIGLVAALLAAGQQCWAMSSFTYDVWSENVNLHKSVVRNPTTAPALHAEEWAALQRTVIKDHLRTKRAPEGEFEWADVNWRSWSKVSGVPSLSVPWPEDAEDVI